MKIKATKSASKPERKKSPASQSKSADDQLRLEAELLVSRALSPKRPAANVQPTSRQQQGRQESGQKEQGRAASPKNERPRNERSKAAHGGGSAARPVSQHKEAEEQEQPSTPTLRLFYALRVPTEVANPLAELQRQLKGNWRKVRADQMHVTLCYLPSVPPERLDDLKRLGVELMQELAPMQISLRGTGYFPNEGSPRVWFVKVEAEGLNELAQHLRSKVQELGLSTEDVPFKAHITLARKKGPAPRVPPKTFDLGWAAAGGTLYRSILRKTGPIYEVESTFRFRGTSPPAAELPITPDLLPSHQELP